MRCSSRAARAVQLESVKAVPALLCRHEHAAAGLPEERRSARPRALPAGPGPALQANLDSLHTPLILPSDLEGQRRTLVRKWVNEVGDYAVDMPKPTPPSGSRPSTPRATSCSTRSTT